jgi:Lrp/AsnC family transcriptional regulator for asnA, asnC and gidA
VFAALPRIDFRILLDYCPGTSKHATVKTRNTYVINAIDAKIVELLQEDGRRSNVEIARRIGVAEATVRKRIERLVRERVVQIGAWPDPLRIGYQTYALIEIEAHLGQAERVAARLASFPEIFFLAICTGRYDLMVAACFRSNDEIHDFMTRRLPRVPGIQRITTSNITRLVKRAYAFPIPTPPDPAGRRRGASRSNGRGGPARARTRATGATDAL